jgi:hypothetical protein
VQTAPGPRSLRFTVTPQNRSEFTDGFLPRYGQTLDHFAKGATPNGNTTFNQRICTYDSFVADKARPNFVFFYTGNESPVEVPLRDSDAVPRASGEDDDLPSAARST